MSYYDLKYYCKQNLKEEDREELDHWHKTFTNVIDGAEVDFDVDLTDEHSKVLAAIKSEIVKSFVELLKDRLGITMQEHVVSVIDHYKEPVGEVEKPETFYYVTEDDNEDEE